MSPLKTLLATAALIGAGAAASALTTPPAQPATGAQPSATAQAAAPSTAAPAAGAPAAGAATTATATGGSKVAAGATVLDPQGGQVGTIKSVDATGAIVSTGTHEVKLPMASFANGPNGPVISMTKAQLDQAAGQAAAGAKANLSSQLTVGSKIYGPQGGEVGSVEANDGQFVTVATAKNKVKLPMNAFAGGPNGAVIGLTQAQLDAEAAKAGAPPAGGK